MMIHTPAGASHVAVQMPDANSKMNYISPLSPTTDDQVFLETDETSSRLDRTTDSSNSEAVAVPATPMTSEPYRLSRSSSITMFSPAKAAKKSVMATPIKRPSAVASILDDAETPRIENLSRHLLNSAAGSSNSEGRSTEPMLESLGKGSIGSDGPRSRGVRRVKSMDPSIVGRVRRGSERNPRRVSDSSSKTGRPPRRSSKKKPSSHSGDGTEAEAGSVPKRGVHRTKSYDPFITRRGSHHDRSSKNQTSDKSALSRSNHSKASVDGEAPRTRGVRRTKSHNPSAVSNKQSSETRTKKHSQKKKHPERNGGTTDALGALLEQSSSSGSKKDCEERSVVSTASRTLRRRRSSRRLVGSADDGSVSNSSRRGRSSSRRTDQFSVTGRSTSATPSARGRSSSRCRSSTGSQLRSHSCSSTGRSRSHSRGRAEQDKGETGGRRSHRKGPPVTKKTHGQKMSLESDDDCLGDLVVEDAELSSSRGSSGGRSGLCPFEADPVVSPADTTESPLPTTRPKMLQLFRTNSGKIDPDRVQSNPGDPMFCRSPIKASASPRKEGSASTTNTTFTFDLCDEAEEALTSKTSHGGLRGFLRRRPSVGTGRHGDSDDRSVSSSASRLISGFRKMSFRKSEATTSLIRG